MQSLAANPDSQQPQKRRVTSPAFNGPISAEIHARPGAGSDDEANTAQTVGLMISFVQADTKHPAVRNATLSALSQARPGETPWEAIFRWIKEHVRFEEDSTAAFLAGLPNPFEAEVLIRPADILAMPEPAGDCDDFVMLSAAMLLQANLLTRLVTIEQDANMPGLYSHVYAEVQTPSGWLPFDASHGSEVGWHVPPVPNGKKRYWSLSAMPSSSIGFAQPAGTSTGINWGSVITDVSRTVANAFAPRVPTFTAPTLPGQPPLNRYDDPAAGLFAEPLSNQTLLLGGAVGLVLLIALMKQR